MDLEVRTVPFELEELKATGDKWQFAGYASTYGGEPDSYGDVVLRGAFDDSLARRPKPKFLWQHDQLEPIGVVKTLASDDRGLKGTWQISKTTRGKDAYELLKDGAVDSLSIGFVTQQAEYDDLGIRLLKAVDLLEVSLVSIPANERAIVTAIKADLPFDALCKRSVQHMTLAVAEAKALHDRRAAEGRELSERHMEALAALLDEAKAASEALAALQKAPEVEARRSLTTRLEFARRRLVAAGLLENVA